MLVGVVSDTHDNLATAKAAFDFFATKGVKLVVHCGDWKSPAFLADCATYAEKLKLEIRGVLGNNDKEVAAMLTVGAENENLTAAEGVLEMVMYGTRIAAYHGHHKPTLRRVMESDEYDVVLLGHTHKPLIMHEANTLIVNPGSTAFAIPRSKSWKPTVAIVDLVTVSADMYYLHDDGWRVDA
ncbi:MAG TPA: metallophosphoesterase [Candidatus Saccharimonadales bacterium]|jgi:hypothetical protein